MAVLNDDQRMLRDSAKTWARKRNPVAAFRALRDSGTPLGFDPQVWSEMADLGWAGIVIPEAHGGSELGYLSIGVVMEELGRMLTASPLLASGLAAASFLSLGGTEEQRTEWLPKIADGTVVGTLAVDETARHAPENTALTTTRSAQGFMLSGTKTFVLEGMAANLLVVSARTTGQSGDPHGISLFLVPADTHGVSRQHLALMDSRGAARIDFDKVEVGMDALLGPIDEGHELLEKVLDRARAGLCAEMLGAATQAFETTLDYLKVRVQFGQKIGSFQALQHRAAQMFTDLQLARSTVEAALQAIDDDRPDVPELVSLAKAKMGDTFHRVSNEMIQMHGGIGMTDEHDAGFYLKRARCCEATFGNQAYHRDRYARIHGY